jgi:hypothetical protein
MQDALQMSRVCSPELIHPMQLAQQAAATMDIMDLGLLH